MLNPSTKHSKIMLNSDRSETKYSIKKKKY